MKIPLQPITSSSQITGIGYNIETNTLDIRFKKYGNTPANESVYRYSAVPPEVHAAMMGAESIGKEFTASIKPFPKRYPFRRLTQKELE